MKRINCSFKELDFIVITIVLFVLISVPILILSYNPNYSIYEKSGVKSVKTVKVCTDGRNFSVDIPKAVKLYKPFHFLIDISEFKHLKNKSIATGFAYSNVKVYADNSLIYEIKKDDSCLVNSGAYSSVIFDIPDDIKSSYLEVYIEPLLNVKADTIIKNILIGRKSDILMERLQHDALSIIISLFLIANFIISLIINFKIRTFLKGEHYSIFHLSILGFITGIYFLAQLWTTNYLFGNIRIFIYFSEYISLLLILAPTCLFIKYKVDVKFAKFFDLIVSMLLLNTLVQFILTILKISEFKEMITISHFVMSIAIVFILVSIFFTNSKKYPSKHSLFIPIVAMMISTIIPLIYYFFYQVLIVKNLSLIISFSLIILESKELYGKYLFYKEEQISKDIYKNLAITDCLTGLFNRQAHEDFIKNIEETKIAGWILSIDLNNLKYINDKFGHSKGDKLIIDFAEILKKIQFENNKINSFKIGGDEFFMFIKENKDYNVDELVDNLKNLYSKCDDFESGFKPSFSAGFHYYDPTDSKKIIDIYNIADKLMYKDKAKYKKLFRHELSHHLN